MKWTIKKRNNGWLVMSPRGMFLYCYTWEQAWCLANFVAFWDHSTDMDAVIMESFMACEV